MVSTVAGKPTVAGFSGDDGYAVNAELYNPWGIATSPQGDLVYWTESTNCVLRRMVASDGQINTMAGAPGDCGCEDGPARGGAKFGTPAGITTNGTDYIIIADLGCNAIRRLQISTGMVTTIAGVLGDMTYGWFDGPALAGGLLDRPTGVAYDASRDRLYIAGE